jgi:hypothetical protein
MRSVAGRSGVGSRPSGGCSCSPRCGRWRGVRNSVMRARSFCTPRPGVRPRGGRKGRGVDVDRCSAPSPAAVLAGSPLPVLALQYAGELPHRRAGDQLDRHTVRAQRVCQPLRVSSAPGAEGQATVTTERDVEARRVGARCAPATLALDDPPPQGDAAEDGAQRLAQRAAAADEARRRRDRARGVESARTVGLRRGVQRGSSRPPPAADPVASSLTEGDRLAPRQPDGAVEGRAEAEALPARDDEPTPPADDRLRVVGRARGPGPLGRDLLRLARRLGRLLLGRLFWQLARNRLLERLDRNSATRLADLHRCWSSRSQSVVRRGRRVRVNLVTAGGRRGPVSSTAAIVGARPGSEGDRGGHQGIPPLSPRPVNEALRPFDRGSRLTYRPCRAMRQEASRAFPVQESRRCEIVVVRRARSATRLKLHREAVGGSRKFPGGVDESATGSTNSVLVGCTNSARPAEPPAL